MYTPELLLNASLRRLQKRATIQQLCHDRIFYQTVKFNGSAENFLKRSDEISLRKRYSPVCDIIASNFFQLNLPYQKAFLFTSTEQHFQPMFENTAFQKTLRCQDEVFVWDIKELKQLYDFYKVLS